jgi:hypothetical protein
MDFPSLSLTHYSRRQTPVTMFVLTWIIGALMAGIEGWSLLDGHWIHWTTTSPVF